MKPNDNDTIIERLLHGHQPPAAPPELRARVLAAARKAEPAPDAWSKLWNHDGLRMAWAASVMLLLAGHALVGTGNAPAGEPVLVADNKADEYLVDFLQPTRISENAQPIVGLLGEGDALTDLELEGNFS